VYHLQIKLDSLIAPVCSIHISTVKKVVTIQTLKLLQIKASSEAVKELTTIAYFTMLKNTYNNENLLKATFHITKDRQEYQYKQIQFHNPLLRYNRLILELHGISNSFLYNCFLSVNGSL